MIEKKVNINGREYAFKMSWGAMYLFEEAMGGASFDGEKLMHRHLMICCMLGASNPDAPLTFDELGAALDADPSLSIELTEALVEVLQDWSSALSRAKKKVTEAKENGR